jgi:hypothetical protein
MSARYGEKLGVDSTKVILGHKTAVEEMLSKA